MTTDKDDDPAIEKNITDIQKIFPNQLTLSQQQFALLRNKSVLTLSRERKKCVGAEYKNNNGQIEYPVRKVAEWMHNTIKTA